MKRICGIGFYWGKTKILRLKLDKPELEWPMELYGISIKNTFLGIMVRGKRVVETPKAQSWGSGVDRMSGAYDDSEILQSQVWH